MKIYVVAILKNESSYLDEWIKYHILYGIDGILLYDNNTDEFEREKTRDIVKIYDNVSVKNWNQYDNISTLFNIKFNNNSKIGKYIRIYGKNKQQLAYDDAINICKKKNVDILLKLDIDEFLAGNPDINYLYNNLSKTRYGFRLNRYDFGSSNLEKKPTGKVVENYIYREENPSNYKDIIKINKVIDNGTSSHSWYHQGVRKHYYIIFTFMALFLILCIFTKYTILCFVGIIICILLFFQTKSLPTIKNLYINHYITKSKEEYFDRKKEDCALGRTSPEKLERQFKIINKSANNIKDTQSIFRF